MQRTIKTLITAGTVAAVAPGTAVAAGAAIVTSQASLVNGQLTIVGSGAVPGSNVSVDDGPATGQADAHGNFTISGERGHGDRGAAGFVLLAAGDRRGVI